MTVGSATLAIDGGRPVRTAPWPTYDKGDVFVADADIEACVRALRSRLYFRYDYRPLEQTETGRFEARLCEFFGVDYALACASGTTAIALALLAHGLEPGAEVACPGFTFAATPSAILLAGGRPVLVENDENLHPDVRDLRRKCTPRMKAIVVVHMRGFASDMDAILQFANEVGVPVIEDAVPALGASLRGRRLGTIGLAGAFSTQSDKSLNTGEGGFLLTRDRELFARAVVLSGAYEGRHLRHLRDGAPVDVSDLDLPLYSFRMDELRAALAAAAIERLPLRLRIQHANYDYVAGQLEGVEGIRLRQPVAPGAYLGESLLFRVPGRPDLAEWFAAALCADGIDARNLGSPHDANVRCFWNWRFAFPGRSVAEIKALAPRTARYLAEAVDVPLSPTLTRDDCDDLVRAVEKLAAAMPR